MAKEIQADYDGVAPKAGGDSRTLLPVKDEAGERIKYVGKIVEAAGKTARESQRPYVQYKVKVIAPAEYRGIELPYQSVVFLPKEHEYAGIALHFLKCILQPFEGKFSVRPDEWVGKAFGFYVTHEESTKLDNQGNPYINAKVSRVDVLPVEHLVELGVIDSADEAPEWLKAATDALNGAGKKGATKAKAPEPAKGKAPAGSGKKAAEVDPDAPCETCERKLKDHKGLKHEFVEGVPF